MRTGFTSTITSKGQLTIPKAVWNALHLQPGDRFLIWEHNGDIVGQPVTTLPMHPCMSYQQAETTLRAFRKTYGKHFALSLLPPDVLAAAHHYHLLAVRKKEKHSGT